MADNQYTSVSISGYNSSPPPDAGETTAANTVEWDKHKTKLGDPVKTLAESMDTNILAAFAKTINTDADQNNSMAGSLAFAESTLTIASGSVTAKRRNHLIAAETGTTDDLANITTGSVSDFAEMIIRPDSGDTITVKDAATGAGEIHLIDNLDYVMSGDESLTLQRRGADWYETARSLVNALFATQAEMETATSITVVVSPGRVAFNPGVCKAWIEFTVAGADQASLNVSSITDTGAGDWTVNIATDMSGTAFATGASALTTTGTSNNISIGAFSTAAGTFDVDAERSDGALTDPTSNISAWAWGDQ